MTLNFQTINNRIVIGTNKTDVLARDGLIEGATANINQLVIPSFTNDNKPVKEIGCWAFSGYNILRVTIKPSIEIFNKDCFHGCTNLIEINIPITVKYIFDNVFDDCFVLEKVSFDSPSSVVFFGIGVFNTCKKLSALTLPSSIKYLKRGSFSEIEVELFLFYKGKKTFSEISKNDMFGSSNVKIYVPLNGVSTFCGMETTKTDFLPFIKDISCGLKTTCVVHSYHVSILLICSL